MPAAVLKGPGRLEVEEIPIPRLGRSDVLVEIDRCGVCGSDLHMVLEGWGQPGSVPGHEWNGVVVAVGDAVSRWRPGDAVVGGPPERCGRCGPCLAGRPSLCAGRETPGVGLEIGAFARFKVHPEGELLATPAGLSSRAAALAEPLAVALHGISQAGLSGRGRQAGSGGRGEQRVLVSGAGPIGALSIAALRAMGVEDVTCVEPHTGRRALAAKVGATRLRVPEDLEVPTMVEPGRIVDGAVDVVLECSGKARAMEAGLAQLDRGGTMVLVGAGIEAPRFDPNRILLNELVITGAFTYDVDGFERALELLAGGTLPVDDLVEPHDIDLYGILDAMHDLAGGRLAGKVLVKP
jgi:threonine dehydrogenase-like Zn-dependent dehydrogenase